jgi:hypothetical protein
LKPANFRLEVFHLVTHTLDERAVPGLLLLQLTEINAAHANLRGGIGWHPRVRAVFGTGRCTTRSTGRRRTGTFASETLTQLDFVCTGLGGKAFEP